MEHLGVSWEQNLLAIEETESISQWLNNCALSNALDGNSCSWMASDALFADLLHSYHHGFFESSRTGSGFFSPNSMSDARQDVMAQFLYEKQMANAPVQLITGDLKFESSVDEKPLEIEIVDGLFQSPKKKARVSSMPRSAKKAGNNEGNDGAIDGQSTSSHSSENWSNATPRMNSKTRATDPQSLYARKRRERINERLRTLQSLVPNGTKVDISTMLEEAVQYVKFLQLQIQLLSSDELWMYAPIAYNGMLDLQMLQRKQ